MPQMVGPWNGRGKMRVPMIQKVGLYQAAAQLTREGLTAYGYVSNGGITTLGDTMDANLAKTNVLVGLAVSEAYAADVFNRLGRWTNGFIEAAKVPAQIKGKRAMDALQPQLKGDNMVVWESEDWTYYMTNTIAWSQLLADMQLEYTRFQRKDYVLTEEARARGEEAHKPNTHEIIIGLAAGQYNGLDKVTLAEYPGRKFKFGKWEPILYVLKASYEPKELVFAAPYIGAVAYALREIYGGVIEGMRDFDDWCALACYIIWTLRPGGTIASDLLLTANDITDIIWDFIGYEQSMTYRYCGTFEGWLSSSILIGFAVHRIGFKTADAFLVKTGGPGSPYQMRGEIAFYLDKLATFDLSGSDTPFFPPARNRVYGSWILFPVAISVDANPDDPKRVTRLEPTWKRNWPVPTRVDIHYNEATMGSLDVGPSEIKYIRYVPASDVRVQQWTTDKMDVLLVRVPIGETEASRNEMVMQNLMARLTGGEAEMKQGYDMMTHGMSPYMKVITKDEVAMTRNVVTGTNLPGITPAGGTPVLANPEPVQRPPVITPGHEPGATPSGSENNADTGAHPANNSGSQGQTQ